MTATTDKLEASKKLARDYIGRCRTCTAGQDIIAENDLVVAGSSSPPQSGEPCWGRRPTASRPGGTRWTSTGSPTARSARSGPPATSRRSWPRSAPSTRRGLPDLSVSSLRDARTRPASPAWALRRLARIRPMRPRGLANAGSAPGRGQRKGRAVSSPFRTGIRARASGRDLHGLDASPCQERVEGR